jgi:hypothetical protein
LPSLETQAQLAALLEVPELMRAHAPAIARRIAAGIMATPGVVVLGDIDGMCVFYTEGNGSYDGHYLFPPWTRGTVLLRRARMFLCAMFRDYAAVVIRGETPKTNLAARRINRVLGFVPAGEVVNPDTGLCIKYILTKEAFLQKHPLTTM